MVKMNAAITDCKIFKVGINDQSSNAFFLIIGFFDNNTADQLQLGNTFVTENKLDQTVTSSSSYNGIIGEWNKFTPDVIITAIIN